MTYGGTGQVVITQDYEHEDPQNCSTNLMKPLIKVVFSISKPTPLTYWVGSGAAMSSSWTDALPTYRKLCKRYLSRSRGGYSTWSRSRWPPHARTHGHAALSLRANSTELSCQRSPSECTEVMRPSHPPPDLPPLWIRDSPLASWRNPYKPWLGLTVFNSDNTSTVLTLVYLSVE